MHDIFVKIVLKYNIYHVGHTWVWWWCTIGSSHAVGTHSYVPISNLQNVIIMALIGQSQANHRMFSQILCSTTSIHTQNPVELGAPRTLPKYRSKFNFRYNFLTSPSPPYFIGTYFFSNYVIYILLYIIFQ